MPFTYNIQENKKDGHKFAEITGFDGKIERLIIPDELSGAAVEAVGNHAFSGRDDIVAVSIPKSVKTLYGFAFHNCRRLKKITLFDSIDDYYDGVCRQCDSLTDIDITIKRDWYEVIRNFLADNDKTLRFTITKKSIKSRLTFPEYVYDFSDNTMARTIQFSISGSGYAYRECVDRKSINYREYDRLFERAVIDGNTVSEDIAVGRLLFPYELHSGYKATYEEYVKKNMHSILRRYIKEAQKNDEVLEEIKRLTEYASADGIRIISDADMDYVIKLASDNKLTLLSALLMDGMRGTADKATEFRF